MISADEIQVLEQEIRDLSSDIARLEASQRNLLRRLRALEEFVRAQPCHCNSDSPMMACTRCAVLCA